MIVPNKLTEYTCLITGSTSGIGKATAILLARKDWHIILHGRKGSDCRKVKKEIVEITGNKKVDYITADLSLMNEVKAMAKEIRFRFPNLNVMVNNAGTFSMERVITKEGYELTWAVNYLSRFLLVKLLIDLLKKNSPSKIVDVAGAYHSKGKIYFDDINLTNNYSYSKANSQSKLANVLFTYKLADKLKGSNITVNCLHPGVVNTGSILRAPNIPSFFKLIYKIISIFSINPIQGAATSVYLASSPEVEGISGKYFIDKKERKSAPQTYDKELQNKLWKLSEKMIKTIQ